MPDGTDATTQPLAVTTRTVACDGGDGADGHPKVYLQIKGTQIRCPYCFRLFILQPGSGEAGH